MVLKSFFMQLVKPIKWHLFFGLFLSCIAALSNFGLLFLSGWLIASAAIVGMAGIIVAQTFNILLPASGVRFFATSRIVTRYLERVITHDGALRVTSLIRQTLYRWLIPLTPAGLYNQRGGDLLGRFVSDSESIAAYYTDTFIPFIRALICSIVFVVIFYCFLPVAAFTLMTALCISGFIISLCVYFISYRYIQKMFDLKSNLQADLSEIIRHFSELYIYNAIDQYLNKIKKAQAILDQSKLILDFIESFARVMITFIMMLCAIVVLFQANQAHYSLGLDLAEIPMLVLGTMAAFDVIIPLPLACHVQIKARLAQKRLRILSDAKSIEQKKEIISSVTSSTRLIFDRVKFSYPHNLRQILQDASLEIKQGEKVAIIGESGIGKTSLINLVFSFYPIQAGKITFDNKDVNVLNIDNLSSFISIVSQDFHLFSGTIKDNFKIIMPEVTDEEIYEALKIVQLDYFIAKLPKNINSNIGNNAIELSGGQARRLAIAIAILRKTPWLILDEPTDGLDPSTEKTMMQALLKLYVNKTLIIITHKKTILPLMDKVYLLEDGYFRNV